MVPTLKTLFHEDQKDRTSGVEYKILLKKDKERRKVARLLIKEKEKLTPEEIYYAALLFHHSPHNGDIKKAKNLALLNIKRGESLKKGNRWIEKSKWLVAGTTDRLLVREGKPQKYGTQFFQKSPNSPRKLFAYEKNTTDEERVSLNVPTLKQTLAELKEMDEKYNKKLK